ncbi:MAG: hypothetical protein ACHQ16_03525 [Candidatus Lutacidiplasmatales archaeon]
MTRSWRTWAAFGALAICAVMIGNLGTGIGSSATTYSVAFSETGLPAGTSWSTTFNSVVNTGTTSTLTYTGVSAGSYYFQVANPVSGTATTTRYVPYSYYGYLTVPNQLHVTIAYTKQYMVNFGVTPVSSGTSGPGTGWYNAGATIPIQASETFGYTFHNWGATPAAALSFTNTLFDSTAMTVSATGTVTAHFVATKFATSFTEVGLPTAKPWSVVFGGTSHLSTTATVTTGNQAPAGYLWSVAPVSVASGTQYTPMPASGTMTVPTQLTQDIVFVKQFSVTFGTNPSSSGTTSPGVGSIWVTNGSNIPITALNTASWVFSTWITAPSSAFGVGSKTVAGTNTTVSGTGTLTAKFVAGTPCTTCTVTFTQLGLPAGTGWGITWGGVVHATTATTLAITGQTAAQSWTAFSGIGSNQFGVQYYPVAPNTGTYWYLGQTATYTIVYQKEYYVTIQTNPTYSAGTTSIGSGWFPAGSQNAITGETVQSTKFSSWSAGANLTLTSAIKAATAFTVNGPATLTANFVPMVHTMHFFEYGLPGGTTWGASIGSQSYWSNTPYINITGIPDGYYGWGASTAMTGGAGIQWNTLTSGGSITMPLQNYQAVVYAEQFQVNFVAGGTTGGSTSPSGLAWYYAGIEVPLMASNGTSVSFTGWSQVASTGTLTITSTTAASTFATINGAGTITGTFA